MYNFGVIRRSKDIRYIRGTMSYGILYKQGVDVLELSHGCLVTLFTTEAEFIVVASSCQAVWMRRVLKKLDCDHEG
ncbi:hypothetical protein OSB04_019223 [Centaurea solstitialis]|uniref:Uncharacterized protein n=1 Tax=Centaurea solstitialis TaxID=347529 RepID=A0AA38WC66_9ASTR|nr:hypothetical protein OSB04_019223 [Centaurea solstitialis]